MAAQIIPLKALDVSGHISTIEGLISSIDAYKNMKVKLFKVPGVPDIPKMIKSMLQKVAVALVDKI